MFLLVGAMLFCTGLVLGVMGIRGRLVDRAPRCAGCAFDLTGLLGVTSLCPECGRNITWHESIRFGTHRRSPARIVRGTALAFLGIVIASAPALSRKLGIDWNRYKPVWLLVHEAVPPTRMPTSSRALAELHRRCTNGDVSHAQSAAIVRAMLRAQADTGRWWNPVCGDLVLAAIPYHEHPKEALDQYVRQILDLEVRTDVAYFQDRPMPIDLVSDQTRIGTKDSWWMTATLESITINGVTTTIDPEDPRPGNAYAGRWCSPWRTNMRVRYPFSAWVDAPEGTAAIEATWTISAMSRDASAAWSANIHNATKNGAKTEEIMDRWEDYGTAQWTHTWSGAINVVAPDRFRYVAVDDSISETIIDECLKDVYVDAGRHPEGVSIWVGGVFRNPPVDVAYEIQLVTPKGTRPLGRVGGLADEEASFLIHGGIDALEDRFVTLRFIPHPDYASRRQGMMTIDSHELVREHLLVDWMGE